MKNIVSRVEFWTEKTRKKLERTNLKKNILDILELGEYIKRQLALFLCIDAESIDNFKVTSEGSIHFRVENKIYTYSECFRNWSLCFDPLTLREELISHQYTNQAAYWLLDIRLMYFEADTVRFYIDDINWSQYLKMSTKRTNKKQWRLKLVAK